MEADVSSDKEGTVRIPDMFPKITDFFPRFGLFERTILQSCLHSPALCHVHLRDIHIIKMHINTANPDLNFKLGGNMYVCFA